jgi:ABC-type sugar transport system ATPase subunit
MIYISHKFEEVFRLADRITVLRDGRYITTRLAAETNESEMISAMVGRELSDLFPKDTTPQETELLRIENLSFTPRPASDKRPLHDISFTLRRGEILGVAGLMGSGRTELLEAIYGCYPQSEMSGAIVKDGKPISISSPHAAISHGIALVSEDRKTQSLVPGLAVFQNLTLAALRDFSRYGIIRGRNEMRAAREEITSLRIKTPGPAAPVETLSGGNQQKVVLGKCLMTHPDILLLDEPTRGIDVGAKAEIYQLMSNIASRGTAILMASSELPELLAMCDRILVLHDGQLATILNQRDANQVNIMEAATKRIATGVAAA